MLLWQRDDKTRKLEKDLSMAVVRYQIRFGTQPEVILVREVDVEEFLPVKGTLNIKTDKHIVERHFGLL